MVQAIECIIMIIMASNVYVIKSWVLSDVSYPVDMKLYDDEEQAADDWLNRDLSDQAPTEQIKFIYPGTKWCGAGNIASGYDDLGPAAETDSCCRDHDNCPDIIPGGETKYNLTNKAFYTRLSCKCDEQFRVCLRRAGDKAANNVGVTYFNIIGTQCFREDYPIKRCRVYSGVTGTKCIKYEYDTTQPKRYQWFDVPNYYKKVQ